MTLQTSSVHSSYPSKLLQTLLLGSAIAAGGLGSRAIAQENDLPKPLDNEPVATQKEEMPATQEEKPTQETEPRIPGWLLVASGATGLLDAYLTIKRKNKGEQK